MSNIYTSIGNRIKSDIGRKKFNYLFLCMIFRRKKFNEFRNLVFSGMSYKGAYKKVFTKTQAKQTTNTMDAKSLMIGNYIRRNDLFSSELKRVEKIIGINKKVTVSGPIKVICPYDDISPIPLTEEWFVKFGAIKDVYGDLHIQLPNGHDMRVYLVNDFIQTCKGIIPMNNYAHIDKVHLFQNWYYFHTGEELTIK